MPFWLIEYLKKNDYWQVLNLCFLLNSFIPEDLNKSVFLYRPSLIWKQFLYFFRGSISQSCLYSLTFHCATFHYFYQKVIDYSYIRWTIFSKLSRFKENYFVEVPCQLMFNSKPALIWNSYFEFFENGCISVTRQSLQLISLSVLDIVFLFISCFIFQWHYGYIYKKK